MEKLDAAGGGLESIGIMNDPHLPAEGLGQFVKFSVGSMRRPMIGLVEYEVGRLKKVDKLSVK
jgi:hypothetical protein